MCLMRRSARTAARRSINQGMPIADPKDRSLHKPWAKSPTLGGLRLARLKSCPLISERLGALFAGSGDDGLSRRGAFPGFLQLPSKLLHVHAMLGGLAAADKNHGNVPAIALLEHGIL